MTTNRLSSIFGVKYPIVQGGMVWCSGWRLASAVSNSGGLGLIGAGSMHPETLEEHIKKCKLATNKPFGVNVPLIYPQVDEIMEIIIKEQVPIVFTSAGNPKLWTKILQDKGIKVGHVVASSKFALKCQDAGVDVVVAEGFEAGGHNGFEETSTMALIPQVRKVLDIPLIAAGGIATGEGMYAAMALGADGVQIGTAFAITQESSASDEFKNFCLSLKEGDTMLSLKKVGPTRLIKNDFYKAVVDLENRGASAEEIKELLGKGRSKKGMFLGDLNEGELEIGQVVSLIDKVDSVDNLMKQIVSEFDSASKRMSNIKF